MYESMRLEYRRYLKAEACCYVVRVIGHSRWGFIRFQGFGLYKG